MGATYIGDESVPVPESQEPSGLMSVSCDTEDCCGNGRVPPCQCTANMSACLIEWECKGLESHTPHKIRIVKEVGGVIEVIFETSLASGSWVPTYQEEYTEVTVYRVEVCCENPGPYAACEYSVVGELTLYGNYECAPCTPIATICPLGWHEFGTAPVAQYLVVELTSDVVSCVCSGTPFLTTDWEGIYAVQLNYSPTECPVADTTIWGDSRSCPTIGTVQDFLRIQVGKTSGAYAYARITIGTTGGTAGGGGQRQWYYVLTSEPNVGLRKGYSDCPGMILSPLAEQDFSFVSSTTTNSGWGCVYPSTYGPIVSVKRA